MSVNTTFQYLLILALTVGVAGRAGAQSPQAPAKATPQSPGPSPPAFWPPAAPVPVPTPVPNPPAAPRQPPRDFATPPAPDVAPPPAPPAPPRVDLGDAEETEVKYTKTTRRGGIIINNDAPHASNTLYVGNSGWGTGGGTPNPPAAPRQPSRDFAQPPSDGGSPAPATSTGRLRVARRADASHYQIHHANLFQRIGNVVFDRSDHATPVVQETQLLVPLTRPAPPADAAPPAAPAPIPAAPGKRCLFGPSGFAR